MIGQLFNDIELNSWPVRAPAAAYITFRWHMSLNESHGNVKQETN